MHLSLCNSFSFGHKTSYILCITSGLFQILEKFWRKFGCGNEILITDVHTCVES